jgi:transposase
MPWTEVLQGLRRMKFEDIYGRWQERRLSQAEAAEILGMSERTFRRWRDRYQADGLEGLLDRRLDKVSARRVPVDQVDRVLSLYRERYPGFTAKHFHDKLGQHHDFKRSYTWTKLRLQDAGLVAKAPRRSAHRKRRPRRPLTGMMLHQDGSRHRWLEGLDAQLDLIVTMDDATSSIYSAFLVDEEGTQSSFQGLAAVIAKHGLPCSLYTDRGSHYFHTPKAGEKVDKEHLTQVGRALAQLGIGHIAAYSPEARGRSERAFGTLQDRARSWRWPA